MDYYCNICKKNITKEDYRYSMNKYRRPLCSTHQQEHISVHTQDKLSESTKSLQSIMKRRQLRDTIQETVEDPDKPRSIKDWIDADINTWDELLNTSKQKKD